jgi:protein-disulfide isomerase
MRVALTGVLCAALAALVTLQAVFTLEVQHKPLPPEAALKIAVANYAMSPRLEFPPDDRDVRFGAADAPMQLVVFSDFECPGCRAFAARLAKLVGGSKGKVSAVFKHYPVDPECNRNVKESHHPHACAAARAAEAARLQGKFAEFHDALFAETVPLTDDVVARVAKATGLDATRFDADRAAEDARRKIADDIELGIRLNVQETPTVFLNGRKVPDISPGAFGLIMMSQANDKPISLTKKATPVTGGDEAAPVTDGDPAHKPAEDH